MRHICSLVTFYMVSGSLAFDLEENLGSKISCLKSQTFLFDTFSANTALLLNCYFFVCFLPFYGWYWNHYVIRSRLQTCAFG